jgi:uncharacterized protein involved in exopolysaccharide biosynthesis
VQESTVQEIRDTAQPSPNVPAAPANWVANATLLWTHRRMLVRVTLVALVLGAVYAFLVLPKQYNSVARLMPPDQQGGSSAAVLAALAGRSLGGLGALAGGLLGSRPSTALYIDLLHSRTIGDHIVDRFDLMHVYHNRYHIDAAKRLAHHTIVVDDKKSGIITLTVTDTDPVRARAIAQAYLDELNTILTTMNTSSAHRERVFIEKRLVSAKSQLQDAERALSEFSSVNTTLDIKEQTRATVDAAAKLQGELIVGQGDLDSLQQVYGDENVRVRAAKARVAGLQRELVKLSGNSAALPSDSGKGDGQDNTSLYPSLRQLPRLAVPYAELYRTVRVQETVFELLSQQYETSRIEEAKDTPVVSVFDPPLVPEKKSFPPRLLVTLGIAAAIDIVACFFVLMRQRWRTVSDTDPRRVLVQLIAASLRARSQRFKPRGGLR